MKKKIPGLPRYPSRGGASGDSSFIRKFLKKRIRENPAEIPLPSPDTRDTPISAVYAAPVRRPRQSPVFEAVYAAPVRRPGRASRIKRNCPVCGRLCRITDDVCPDCGTALKQDTDIAEL